MDHKVNAYIRKMRSNTSSNVHLNVQLTSVFAASSLACDSFVLRCSLMRGACSASCLMIDFFCLGHNLLIKLCVTSNNIAWPQVYGGDDLNLLHRGTH
jgi:hypothetical protein